MLLCGTSLPKETEKCPPVCSVLSPACRDQTFGRGAVVSLRSTRDRAPADACPRLQSLSDLPEGDVHSETTLRLTVPRRSETSEASG